MLNRRSSRVLLVCLLPGCLLAIAALRHSPKPVMAQATSASASTVAYVPAYTKDGDLVPPLQYREWIYLTSGLDMNYFPKSDPSMSSFDNVFVNPEAYRSFLATGTWPDKTVIVLEGRGASSKGSINKAGHFQSGGLTGLEIHVKDVARFPGKWAFFDVASESKATLFPQTANCYSCHTEHAAVDTTFVQFYPTLLPIAQKKGTLSRAYLKETAAETAK
jgi:hypothetical protein